jgi:hypothetical protein
MADDIVRVLRVLEYVGPRSMVDASLLRRAVKGSLTVRRNASSWSKLVIREAIIGELPELFEQTPKGVKQEG